MVDRGRFGRCALRCQRRDGERSGLCLCRDRRRQTGGARRRGCCGVGIRCRRAGQGQSQKGDRLPVGRCRRYGLLGGARLRRRFGRPDRLCVRGFDGLRALEEQTAYAAGARIAFSTPSVGPNMVVVGSRGTNGAIRGFEKSSDAIRPRPLRPTAAVRRARSSSKRRGDLHQYGRIRLRHHGSRRSVRLEPRSDGRYVRTGKTLSAGRCQPCVGADNCVYLPGKIKEGSGGSWNIACFDCTNLTASSTKTPKWSAAVPDGFVQGGASLSADGQTLYIVADAATPSTVYALSTSNGSTVWSYPLDAHCNSVPAVDNLDRCMSPPRPDTTSCCRPTASGLRRTDRRHVRGFGLDLRVGLLLRAGQRRFGGKLKVYAVALPGVNSAAASAWSQYGRNARHINYQQ